MTGRPPGSCEPSSQRSCLSSSSPEREVLEPGRALGGASTLSLAPIGHVRSPFLERGQAPRQPRGDHALPGRIELLPGRGYEHALEDLAGFSVIWVLFWFHLNGSWRPKVRPPRSQLRRGVFATRSPHRPNPLGLSAVELLGIQGLTLHIAGVDMLDGTPVLDIKPYVPYADAFAEAQSGWLEAPVDPLPDYSVELDQAAVAQADALRTEFGVDLLALFEARLRLGPAPHPYRRIRVDGAGFRIAVKDFRARFRVDGRTIIISEFLSGYRARELAALDRPELEMHRVLEGLRPPSSH